MPPRKRKAPLSARGQLSTVQEADEDGACCTLEQPQPSEPCGNVNLSSTAQFTSLLAELDAQVEEKTRDLLRSGKDAADRVREEGIVLLVKVPKKVRDMSVAQFLGLADNEGQHMVLPDLLARVAHVASQEPSSQAAAGASSRKHATVASAAAEAVPCDAAPATRATRRTAARTAPALVPPSQPSLPASRELSSSTQLGSIPAVGQDLVQDSTKAPAASEPFANITNTKSSPATVMKKAVNAQSDALVAQTPAVGGGLPLATPAASTLLQGGQLGRTAARTLQGGMQSSVLTGFTLVKRTAARSRTRKANDNAIVISTQDGQQFMVDAATGLAAVPDKYRAEVAQQLEVMRQLAAAALGMKA